jgi:hypothetical protein
MQMYILANPIHAEMELRAGRWSMNLVLLQGDNQKASVLCILPISTMIQPESTALSHLGDAPHFKTCILWRNSCHAKLSPFS